VVQVHAHGGDARQCRRRRAGLQEVVEVESGAAGTWRNIL